METSGSKVLKHRFLVNKILHIPMVLRSLLNKKAHGVAWQLSAAGAHRVYFIIISTLSKLPSLLAGTMPNSLQSSG